LELEFGIAIGLFHTKQSASKQVND